MEPKERKRWPYYLVRIVEEREKGASDSNSTWIWDILKGLLKCQWDSSEVIGRKLLVGKWEP